MLGDVHGGAGEQCVALLNEIAAHLEGDATDGHIADAIDAELRALGQSIDQPRAGLWAPLSSRRPARTAPARFGR